METRKLFSTQLKSMFVIYGLLAVIFLTMTIISPTYRSIENIWNVIVQVVPLAIVSLGQMIVMIGGGIDMSVGSIISLSTCIAAVSMASGSVESMIVGLLLVFAAAVGIGLLNGMGVNYCKVPAMITTLSMMIVLDGVSQWVLPVAGGKVNPALAQFLTARVGLISMPLVILIIVYLLVRVFLYKTKAGVAIYAIGNNRHIASSMGIKVKYTSILTYVIVAILAAVTGLLLASRMRIGDPLTGTTFGLDSITAAAIGGTALTGGVGLVAGSIAGALLIGMLSNIMNILGINHFYQYVLKGLLLVIAMIIYSITSQLAVKRNEK